jgi:glycosyltransferase involved in cell wall biosynthesis
MRVALLSDGVSPYVMGGIQRHTRMLAIHLVRAGAQVSLFHTTKGDQEFEVKAKSLADFPKDVLAGIHNLVVEYPQPGYLPGHYIGDSHRYSERLLSRYRREQIAADFIYAQGLTGLAFANARRASPDSLPPIGVNQHGYEMFQYAADLKTHLQHLMLRGTFARLARRADFVFSFPARIREIIEKQCRVPADRIIEIPNAIDESWIVENRSMPATVRRFVFIGRHERRKGVPELSKAIKTLPEHGWEFHFVGPIPEELRIRHANVIYHGAMSDTGALQRLLDMCDILVCPSFAEGMPTVVLEAMARGLAIIATDVGATAEWVDQTNGVLLPLPCRSDLPDALAAFLSMPAAQLHRLQLASLTKARDYTWHNVANAVLQAVSSRLTPGRSSARSSANNQETVLHGH